MPIGDSKGAFFEDDFRAEAHPWFIDPKMEGSDKNVIHPNKSQTDKQLDDAELEPSTGMGIEVRAEMEDRRSEPSRDLDMNRLMDPTPLTDSIGGRNSTGAFDEKYIGHDPWIPTELAKKLGINDVEQFRLSDIYKRLGIKPIKEDEPLAPMPKDKDPILLTKPN